MKALGFLFLVTGWAIALAALALLKSSLPRAGFLFTGIALETAGLVLVARAHRRLGEDRT